MHSNSQLPIGIFDSGIGGLTVAHAVKKHLPHEHIVYFGDTAHLPYGDKSAAAIQAYSIKICDMLLQQRCKLIIIACHSASTAAYDLVKEYVASKAKVIDVVDPVIEHIRDHYANKKIGVIGTRQTIHSNIYKKKIDELNKDIETCSLATPLLVPMIEEGFANNQIMEHLIADYLQQPILQNIDGLMLACTHYPLIKKQIDTFYQQKVKLIDSADIVAHAAKTYLTTQNLLNHEATPQYKFYVSDYTDSFEASTRIFFPETIHLEHYPLWE